MVVKRHHLKLTAKVKQEKKRIKDIIKNSKRKVTSIREHTPSWIAKEMFKSKE